MEVSSIMQRSSEWTVIFSSLNIAEVHLIKTTLAQANIASVIRGELRSSLAGEVPMDDARIELLVHREYRESADAHIRAHLQTDRPDWRCSTCGESNPGNFQHCWNCSANRIHHSPE